MKPLILFDLDGTLITANKKMNHLNTEIIGSPKEEMKKIAAQHGVPPDIINSLNRMAHIWNQTRKYLNENGCPEGKIQTVMAELNGQFMVEERADHKVSALWPDTLETLQILTELGYEMGVVTTASKESYEHISQSSNYGCFGNYFEYAITRSECKYIKPDPEPIKRLLKLYNNPKFVYVGDTDHDAIASMSAGGIFILINTRSHSEEAILAMSPAKVIISLKELPSVLKFLGKSTH